MYLPDNLSNNVHLMKISPFRFATVEMTDEISLQSQRQRKLLKSQRQRKFRYSQKTEKISLQSQRPGGYIQSNNKEQTFRSAKANPG